ncbi:MAG: DUF2383 domain-containing protein [Jannaschia sp.]
MSDRTDFREALQTLLSRIEESLAGYDEMAARAEADIRPLVLRWKEAHEAHRPDIANLITALGETPDGGGAVRGTVQETVIKMRDAVTGIDEGTLDSLLRGEGVIRHRYEDALAAEPSPEDRAVLTGQLATLDLLRAETKAAAPGDDHPG